MHKISAFKYLSKYPHAYQHTIVSIYARFQLALIRYTEFSSVAHLANSAHTIVQKAGISICQRVQHILQSNITCRNSLAPGQNTISIPLWSIFICSGELYIDPLCSESLSLWPLLISLTQSARFTDLVLNGLKVYGLPKNNHLSREPWSHWMKFICRLPGTVDYTYQS